MNLDTARMADLAERLLDRATKLGNEAKSIQDDASEILDILESSTEQQDISRKEYQDLDLSPQPSMSGAYMSEMPVSDHYPDKKEQDTSSSSETFIMGVQPAVDESIEDLGAYWRPWFNSSHSMVFMSDPQIGDGDLLVFTYYRSSSNISVSLKRNGKRGKRVAFSSFEQVAMGCEDVVGVTFSQQTLNNLWHMLERMLVFSAEEDPFGLMEEPDTVDTGGMDIICRREGKRIFVDSSHDLAVDSPQIEIGIAFTGRHVSEFRLDNIGRYRFGEAIYKISECFGSAVSTNSANTLRKILQDTFMPSSRGMRG